MKKSEQLKNKGIVLVLNNHNTKTKSETLGNVELKYFSYGDSIEFATKEKLGYSILLIL